MVEAEARFILFKASAAYPNQVELEDETIALWVERLANVPFECGLVNLNYHIDNEPRWFPSIANIIRNDLQPVKNHQTLRLEAAEQFAYLENWSSSDAPPPEGFWDRIKAELRGGSN